MLLNLCVLLKRNIMKRNGLQGYIEEECEFQTSDRYFHLHNRLLLCKWIISFNHLSMIIFASRLFANGSFLHYTFSQYFLRATEVFEVHSSQRQCLYFLHHDVSTLLLLLRLFSQSHVYSGKTHYLSISLFLLIRISFCRW